MRKRKREREIWYRCDLQTSKIRTSRVIQKEESKKKKKTTSGVRNSLPENSRRFNGSNGREGVVGRARGSLFRQGDGPKH